MGRNRVSAEDELKSAAVDGASRGVRDRQHEAFAIKKNTHWGAIVYVFCQMGSIEAGWQFFDRAAPLFPTGDAAYLNDAIPTQVPSCARLTPHPFWV